MTKAIPVTLLLLYCTVFMCAQTTESAKKEMPIELKTAIADASIIDSLTKERQFDVLDSLLRQRFNKYEAEKNWKWYFFYTKQLNRHYYRQQDPRFVEFSNRQLFLFDSLQYDDYEIKQSIYSFLGSYYENDRSYDKSIDALNKSLAIIRTHFPQDSIMLAGVYNALGVANMQKGALIKGSEFYQKALNINLHVSKTPFVYEQISDIYINLGIIQKELGNLDAAIKNYDFALAQFDFFESDLKKGLVYYNTGFAYILKRDYPRAVENLKLTESIFKKLFGEIHGHVIAVYNLLSQAYEPLSEVTAVEYMDKSLHTSQELYGPNHPRVAIQLDLIAKYQYQKNDFIAAEINEKKALAIYNGVSDAVSNQKMSCYSGLTTIYASGIPNPDSLAKYLALTEAANRFLFGNKTHHLASLYTTLAKFHIENNPIEAENYIAQALFHNTTNYDTLSDIQIPPLEDFLKSDIGSITLGRYAELKMNVARNDSSQVHAIQEAVSILEQAHRLGQIYIRELNQDPQADYSLINFDVLLNTIELYAEHHDIENAPAHMFTAMEQYKGQNLWRSKMQRKANISSSIPDSVMQLSKELANEIATLEQSLFDSITIENQQKLVIARNDQKSLELHLSEKYPTYFNTMFGEEAISLKDLQSLLSEETAMIQYVFDSEKNNIYIMVIDKLSSDYLTVPFPDELQADVLSLNKMMQSYTLNKTSKRDRFITMSHKIYQTLIHPIIDLLGESKHIVLIGDEFSHSIPFGVLLQSDDKKRFNELDYLINKFEISYHYSGTLYASSVQEKQENSHGLLAFAPVFDDKNRSIFNSTELRSDTLLRTTNAFGEFSPLSYSRNEVTAIADHYSSAGLPQSQLLLYEDASQERLVEAIEKNQKYVHIASHSFANLDNNGFSGIACFTDSTIDNVADKILFMKEIYNLDINADLVVLSSCESGVGKNLQGEGVIGLNRSFIFAGANNVIFTLWKVYDKVTAQFMESLYVKIFEGQSYASALRQTKLEMIKNPATASPQMWAPFLLVGS